MKDFALLTLKVKRSIFFLKVLERFPFTISFKCVAWCLTNLMIITKKKLQRKSHGSSLYEKGKEEKNPVLI